MIGAIQHQIDDDDIAAVVEVLRSSCLTGGLRLERLEADFSRYMQGMHCVALSSGTAALHTAMAALGVGPGDEVIVPALSFVATAACIVYRGATPVFADVDGTRLTMDPDSVAALINPNTKAIITVDYAGHASEYHRLRDLADRAGVALVADVCHGLGGRWRELPSGCMADIAVFSFHPVKAITGGEGGMLSTHDGALARRALRFRHAGADRQAADRRSQNGFAYDIKELGQNYRLNEMQCALIVSQLKKLTGWISRRRDIAAAYRHALYDFAPLQLPGEADNVAHAWHFFPIRTDGRRNTMLRELHRRGIAANVHYVPIHLFSFFREHYATGPGLCPVTESVAEQLISLPVFAAMTDQQVQYVNEAVIDSVHSVYAL